MRIIIYISFILLLPIIGLSQVSDVIDEKELNVIEVVTEFPMGIQKKMHLNKTTNVIQELFKMNGCFNSMNLKGILEENIEVLYYDTTSMSEELFLSYTGVSSVKNSGFFTEEIKICKESNDIYNGAFVRFNNIKLNDGVYWVRVSSMINHLGKNYQLIIIQKKGKGFRGMHNETCRFFLRYNEKDEIEYFIHNDSFE